jgi:hypothetical protein
LNKTKKVFFFEKKNQKTFAPALSPPGVNLRQLARNQTDKGFLVHLFKKEHFPAYGAGWAELAALFRPLVG